MKNKKTRLYLLLALILVLVSVFLPGIINLASAGMVKEILKHTKTEAKMESETGTLRETEPLTETEEIKEKEIVKVKAPDQEKEKAAASFSEEKEVPGQSETISPKRKESADIFEEGMKKFVRDFKPEELIYINLSKEEKAFFREREKKFLKAVAEYLYSLYEEEITITKVVIQGTIEDNADELIFTFLLETMDEESETFYGIYDKELDYFKIYSMFFG